MNNNNNDSDINMKRLLYVTIVLVLILLVVGLLTACEPLPPVIDEKCVDYTAYSFYQIEKDTPLGTSKEQWMLETQHGPIEISDKTYENAMDYQYSEICYERTDAVASSYSYTKKADDIRPEPEIVYEDRVEYITEYITETITETVTVTEYVDVFVDVYTYYEVTEFLYNFDLPAYVPVTDDVWWFTYPVTTEEEELSEFQENDLIIVPVYYNSRVIADDQYWIAGALHIRNGIIISTVTLEEELIANPDSTQEQLFVELTEYPLATIYEILYPAPIVEIPNEG